MSIFKSTLKPYLRRQILARQNLLASLDRPSYFNKWVSGKTPWVKMSSFVNVDDTDALARKYVLFGGTAYSGDDIGPNQLALRSGINVRRGAYGDLGDRSYGVRPMPGIESVEIKSKSAYGSLREAIVHFYVWDKKQLEDVEKLYMRVGYYVLLEYGWSMYLHTNVDSSKTDEDFRTRYPANNSNDIIDINSNILRSLDDPTIDPFDPTLTENRIYDLLENNKFKHSGNYDGMLGVVRNFSWEFIPNGGYKCTTTIISIGDVIDTLKMSGVTGQKTLGTDSDDSYTPTTFELILASLNDPLDNELKSEYKKRADSENIAGLQTDIIRIDKTVNTGEDTRSGYIQLAYFIYILNNQINLFDDKGDPLLRIEIPLYSTTNYGNGLCVGSEDSISVNIGSVLIKNPKAKFISGNPNGYNIPTDVPINDYLYSDTSLGTIGNIYFNISKILKIYQDLLKDGSVYVGVFIRELMKIANLSLGNINAFDIFVIDNVISIVDKQYTEPPADTQKESKFVLKLSGNNTAVRESKIISSIFPSQATIMAIGAQDRANIGAVNSSTQVVFNKGLTNRIKKINVEVNEKNSGYETDLEKRREKINRETAAIISNVLALRSYIRKSIEEGEYADLEETGGSMSSMLNSVILRVNTDANYRAIIPIVLEVTLDGVGGFTIGEIIRVDQDILPTDYNSRNLGFIITGISNNIIRNDWVTRLTTQICLLDQGTLTTQDRGISKEGLASGVYSKIIELESVEEQSIAIHNLLVAFCSDYFEGSVDSSFNIFGPTKPDGYAVAIKGNYVRNTNNDAYVFRGIAVTYNPTYKAQINKIVNGFSGKNTISRDTALKIKDTILNDLNNTLSALLSTETYKTGYKLGRTEEYTLYFPTTPYELDENIELRRVDGQVTQVNTYVKDPRKASIELLEGAIYQSLSFQSMSDDVKNHFIQNFNKMKTEILDGYDYDFPLLASGVNNYDNTTGKRKGDLATLKEKMPIVINKTLFEKTRNIGRKPAAIYKIIKPF